MGLAGGTLGCFRLFLLVFELEFPSQRNSEGGENKPFSTQGKLDQTVQEISAIFQHRRKLVGQWSVFFFIVFFCFVF